MDDSQSRVTCGIKQLRNTYLAVASKELPGHARQTLAEAYRKCFTPARPPTAGVLRQSFVLIDM